MKDVDEGGMLTGKLKELALLRPDKEKDPDAYAEWQAKMLADCTVIKMDPESPEWKAKIAGLQAKLEAKRGKDRPSFVEIGYRVYN